MKPARVTASLHDLLAIGTIPRLVAYDGIHQGDTRDRSVIIRRALGDVQYPVDVIVMASERFEATKDLVGVEMEALHLARQVRDAVLISLGSYLGVR